MRSLGYRTLLVGLVVASALTLVATVNAQLLPQPMLVSAAGTNIIYKYDGVTLTEFIHDPVNIPTYPTGLLFDNDQTLYVAVHGDFGANAARILRYNALTGAFIDTFATGANFHLYDFMIFHPNGHLLVSNENNGGVREYDSTGTFLGLFVSNADIQDAKDMIFGSDGNLWISSGPNLGTKSIRRYDRNTGALLGDVIAPGADPVLFGPVGLELFGGDLLVTEANGGRIIKFDPSDGSSLGYLTTGLSFPQGLEIGPDDGKVYVANFTAHEVRRYLADGSLDATIPLPAGSLPYDIVFVPEPSGVILAGLGWMTILVHRRNRRA